MASLQKGCQTQRYIILPRNERSVDTGLDQPASCLILRMRQFCILKTKGINEAVVGTYVLMSVVVCYGS